MIFSIAFTNHRLVRRLRPRALRRFGDFALLLLALDHVVIAQIRDRRGATANVATSSNSTAKSQPCERPFLWRIDRSPPAFLFGTIHLADDQILNLPPVVDAALEFSDAVITEVSMDVAALEQEMGPRLLLTEGRSLSGILPQPLFERLEKYVGRRGQSMAAFEKNKVWVVAAQVGIIELIQEVGQREGLDLHLARKARALGKETAGLETATEQLDAFDEVALEDQVKSLDRLLNALERQEREGRRIGREMLDGYCQGDEKRLASLMDEWLDPRDPSVARSYELQIARRDRRMAERIDKLLKERPRESVMFAIGAYHLIGSERNVIALLEEYGWKIRRLSLNDAGDIRAKAPADAKQKGPTSKQVNEKKHGEK